MQRMYKTYGDIAEFRMVYIMEAHASDSDWSVDYAVEKNITEHTDYGARCSTADMLLADKQLTIPTVIDGMDDVVNKAYSAYPDRAFIVRKDGRLAVAGARGPWGFVPALEAADTWLAEFKETGREPDLMIPEEAHPFTFETDQDGLQPALGIWDVWVAFKNRQIEAELIVGLKDGELAGQWTGMGDTASPLEDLQFDGAALTFTRTMGEGKMSFAGTVKSAKLEGAFTSPMGEMKTHGERLER